MKNPILPTILASLLLAGTAFAQPVLRADVSVNTDIVTVGDLFAEAGEQADRPIFRAPRLGTTGTVPLADITMAAERIGLVDYDTAGLASVRVGRPATEIGRDQVAGLITADLRDRGTLEPQMTLETRFDGGFEAILAEDVDAPVDLLSLRYQPADGAFVARLALAGHAAPVELSGTLNILVEMPHLTRRLNAGDILSVGDITMRRVPLHQARNADVAPLEDLVGKALRSRSAEGMLLDASDVTEPMMVSRNELVTVYLRNGPMTLTAKGQALGSASEGKAVQVLNLNSNRVIHTTAIAPGAVEVDTDPVETAGL